VTWQEYETGLEDRIIDLHSRVHRGTYRAQPSKRVYIPKLDGRQRPIGIAAVEDKVLQQAVVTILNQICEVDFMGFSYGFRPGRSPHQALDALTVGIQRKKVNWILDADVMGFFDNLSHEWALKFIAHRVADRRVLRLIRKWLKAGVSEDGQWSESNKGTPQGSVASPLIANVYMHYLFDLWADVWRRKVAKGDVIIVRYADDLVMGFQHRADAERFLREFKERLAKFGLELHPDKTRLIEFGRYAASDRKQRGKGKPSPSGGSLRKSGWLRSSKISRLNFNAGCMIAWSKSVHGYGKWYRVTTSIMLFPATSISCTSSNIASIGSGEVFSFVAVRRHERSGRNTARSSTDGFQHPVSCIPIRRLASAPLILRKSRMRKRARTDLSGGRSAMSVPTGTRTS
jgi:group II intron reverse transcriptase/maturase